MSEFERENWIHFCRHCLRSFWRTKDFRYGCCGRKMPPVDYKQDIDSAAKRELAFWESDHE